MLTNPCTPFILLLYGSTAEPSPRTHIEQNDNTDTARILNRPERWPFGPVYQRRFVVGLRGFNQAATFVAFCFSTPKIIPIAPEPLLNPAPGERKQNMQEKTAHDGTGTSGLPTANEATRRTRAPRKATISLDLDPTTARYLRTISRMERRTEEAQALYILENVIQALYFGFEPKIFNKRSTGIAPVAEKRSQS